MKEKGSGMVLLAIPTTWPPLLTAQAKLSNHPGSVPRLVSTPLRHLKACGKKQSSKKQRGSGVELSAVPVTIPWLLRTWSPADPLISKKVMGTELLGPPNVPKSTSLYRLCCAAS